MILLVFHLLTSFVFAQPKGSFVAVQLEKCAACQKTVYAMEKMMLVPGGKYCTTSDYTVTSPLM
jgi:hypothetical protein